VIFEDFVEIISQVCCMPRHTCNLLWAWLAGLVYLTHFIPAPCHPLKLTAVSKTMPTSKVSPWRRFLVDSAAYPWNVFHEPSCSQSVKTVSRVKIFCWYILQMLKNLQTSRN